MARKYDLPKNVDIKRRSLWVRVKQVGGEWEWVPTGLLGLNENGSINEQNVTLAEAFKMACEEEVWRAVKAIENGQPAGPQTVRQRAKLEWFPKRFRDGLTSAKDDETRFNYYVLPVIGDLLMEDVRPHHIDQVMDRVKTLIIPGQRRKKPLGPSSVKTCYWLIHGFFDGWCGRRYLLNPCRGYEDLPKRRDADPLWRFSAYYSVEEANRLISDERIPFDRRVVYAVLFFTGMRWGELAALRWSRWDHAAKPLGRLQIALSYSTKLVDANGEKHGGEKLTKTETPRLVPVHPELAKILAEWKLQWANFYGRPPRDNDLIIPARAPGQRLLNAPDYQAMLDAEPGLTKADLAARLGVSRAAVTQGCRRAPVKQSDLEKGYRSATVGWKRLQEDLDLLGIRRRRTHDVRRTTYSLLCEARANTKIVEFMLWGPSATAVRDVYATISWPAFCEEMIKLPLRRVELSKVLELPAASAEFGNAFGNASASAGNDWGILAPTTGLEPAMGVSPCPPRGTLTPIHGGLQGPRPTTSHSNPDLRPVSVAKLGNAPADPFAGLKSAFVEASEPDRKALRRQLQRLLADLDD